MRRRTRSIALVLLAGLVLFLPGKRTHAQGTGPDIAKRPGYQQPLGKAHPMWAVEQARPNDFQPQAGAVAFSPDGKYLAVTSFHPAKTKDRVVIDQPNGTLYILENPTAKDPEDIVVHDLGSRLFMPLGACWRDDGLYIAERDQVSRWTDADGDGLPERMQTFASGWISDNFHHFTFGLPYHDGYFYTGLSTSLRLTPEEKASLVGKLIADNAPNPEFRGCLLKIDATTGGFEPVAGGLRAPNGVGLGPGGIVLCPDNQGDWKPANAIYVAQGGEFFGKHNDTKATTDFYPDGGAPSLYSDKDPTPPAVWLPQNEAGNSPSATLLIPEGKPFAGQVLVADVTQGAIHRVFMEEVDGVWQGAAFRHTMGLEAGPNDMTWGPDGCLYIGHIGLGAGNWGWDNKRFGLQRLRPTGKTTLEFEKIQATADGFRVSFTKPVPKTQLSATRSWAIDAYTYVPRPEYGGPKKDEHRPTIASITVAEDGRSADLVIPDRKPNYVYHLRIDATTAEGEAMWSPEAWVTFHKSPQARQSPQSHDASKTPG